VGGWVSRAVCWVRNRATVIPATPADEASSLAARADGPSASTRSPPTVQPATAAPRTVVLPAPAGATITVMRSREDTSKTAATCCSCDSPSRAVASRTAVGSLRGGRNPSSTASMTIASVSTTSREA